MIWHDSSFYSKHGAQIWYAVGLNELCITHVNRAIFYFILLIVNGFAHATDGQLEFLCLGKNVHGTSHIHLHYCVEFYGM